MKTIVFTGSFDPFTIGHKNIVDRAMSLCEELVIGIGYNNSKHYKYSLEERKHAIEEIFKYDLNVRVEVYEGLTADFAIKQNADCIIRGVRSTKDFEYEKEQAEVNFKLSGIETLLMFAQPEMECVSSSMVKELMDFGKDVSEFIP